MPASCRHDRSRPTPERWRALRPLAATPRSTTRSSGSLRWSLNQLGASMPCGSSTAALSALFVALAFMSICAWSRRTFMLVGVLLAVTPMTLFMGGVVNPNGLEACAALCMWTAGLVLVLERAEAPPRGLVIVLTASAVVLMLSRGISPVWVVLILVVLAILAGRRAVVQLLQRRLLPRAHCRRGPLNCRRGRVDHRRTRERSDGGPGHTPQEGRRTVAPSHLEPHRELAPADDRRLRMARHPVAPPDLPRLVCRDRRARAPRVQRYETRGNIALIVLVAIVVLVPIAIQYHEAHRLNLFWQGRYTLPMATGIPILATALIDGAAVLGRIRSRLTVLMCIGIGVADFGAFYTTQRRYTNRASRVPSTSCTGRGALPSGMPSWRCGLWPPPGCLSPSSCPSLTSRSLVTTPVTAHGRRCRWRIWRVRGQSAQLWSEPRRR